MRQIRIGTRASRLARIQAEMARAFLEQVFRLNPHLAVPITILPVTSEGDQLQGSLAAQGGKGLFTRSLDQSLLEGKIDVAVHSLKDLPCPEHEDLVIAHCLGGEDPGDALVLPLGAPAITGLEDLPRGAWIGTASPRRQALLAARRPDLRFRLLRGNVPTRLEKLDRGEVAATVLACAGLERLGLGHRVDVRLAESGFLPAANQGVVGLVMRRRDEHWLAAFRPQACPALSARVEAERAVLVGLAASCLSPVGVWARAEESGQVRIEAEIALPDGTEGHRQSCVGPSGNAESLGLALGRKLRGLASPAFWREGALNPDP